MKFSTTQQNKTLNLNDDSNVTFEIDNDSVQIIEYKNGKPRQAVVIDLSLILKITDTEFKIGRYNGNV